MHGLPNLNFKVVVVEKLVNMSRPIRRSVVVMKEHSCSLFWGRFSRNEGFSETSDVWKY